MYVKQELSQVVNGLYGQYRRYGLYGRYCQSGWESLPVTDSNLLSRSSSPADQAEITSNRVRLDLLLICS